MRKWQQRCSLVSNYARSWTMCVSCDPSRVKVCMSCWKKQLHQGKTRVWNRAGIPPEDIEELGEDVWQPAGIPVLGTPTGSGFCGKPPPRCQTCSAVGRSCSSANPRPNTMRTMPPLSSAMYCPRRRDLCNGQGVAGRTPSSRRNSRDRESSIGHASGAGGGLGLRSAVRCVPAAYLASWADALHMISERTPEVADEVVRRLGQEELQAVATELDQKGLWWRPAWAELHAGRRLPQSETREPGEWPHGWQYWASSVLETHFRKNSMLTNRTASRQAHLRSHSDGNAGVVFSHAPTTAEFTVPPHLFRVLFLERLQLPLPLTECNGCDEPLDPLGRHRAACTRTGRIKKISSPTERPSVS